MALILRNGGSQSPDRWLREPQNNHIAEKTLIVGIDVGSETHFVRAFDWRNYEYSKKPLEFSNNETGFVTFKTWMEDIEEKHGKDVVIPGMAQTGHYWYNLGAYLQDNGMKLVHVNPHHVKKSKELDDNNPGKNDRKDPKTIAALVNEGSKRFQDIFSRVLPTEMNRKLD